MRTNYDIIVGIDPDVDKSGYAVLKRDERKVTTLEALGFFQLQSYLTALADRARNLDVSLVVVVEASWMIQANWHVNQYDRRNRAAAKGYDVGRNHQVGKLIVEMCKVNDIPVVEHIPLRKCWSGKDRKITHEELIQFCPFDNKRTNQEERDAALLAWCFADFPIRLKPLKNNKG